ncbi:sodium:calcium exchanger [Romeria aff. gracilis LEGE 07310]|uniref:Sodium:calcium exchanger n=1 Tax=Vasconcelosia minhoensis LEGE 07310 TaxID=915328 RepID=A0A8J7DP41_9CYAN|nr:sodium:calcium exchanger [Romeria gracilis]MBE9079070.1 sodium:calcium exchanger [Romeria aff. gracilis LEGE 07310]
MALLFWSGVLLVSVWAAHWGSDKLAVPLEKLQRQWGLSEAAGAAFVALATASPEIGTNTASAVQGLSDIGLGNLLGSNIISVPAIVTVAFLASRTEGSGQKQRPELQVKVEALTIQALPYIAIIILAAILTVPPAWRGLQPVDGWIMLAAYAVYVAQAILRQRQRGQRVRWGRREIAIALLGVLVLALGAYFVVTATEKIVSILGISELIGGLFITSTLSIAPEVFATWSVARSGQVTAATASVIADNTATMTLAFFPLALVTLPIENMLLYSVNLAFVAIFALLYAAFIQWGKLAHSFERWEVLTLIAVYLIYLAVIVFGVFRDLLHELRKGQGFPISVVF